MNTKLVRKMAANHDCLHEDQIQGQSRAIERLNTELKFKKEKLDDLKKDNERMEEKLDDIQDCVNQLVLKSNSDDDKLNNRLIAIETRQKVQDEMIDKNRADANLRLYIVIVIFTVLTFYFNFVR